jgi:CDP-diacylglycerol--serine O-phosphatidyltransferase
MITKDKMLRGIYILPSLFTTGNLAFGYISIIFSIRSDFVMAAWCLIVSIGMDMVDGRVARWTKSTSRFGLELDSLADLVSFGVAPAVLMYQMVLHTMHKPGLAIALFFVISSALRLAKYNVKAQDGDSSSDFSGLPTPAAAGIIASFVLSYELFEQGQEITVKTIPILMQRMPFFFKTIPLLMVLISFLMISNVPYFGFKKSKLNRPKSLQLLILIVIAILLIVTYPQNSIFIIFMLYLLSGIFLYILRYWRMQKSLKLSSRLRNPLNGSENPKSGS